MRLDRGSHVVVADTVAGHGRLDVMVNNAGVLFSGPFEETTDAHWDLALDVNVRGVIDGARAEPRCAGRGRQAAPGGVQAPRLGTSGPRC